MPTPSATAKIEKKPSTAPAAGGKRRDRPPKATQQADSEQIGLALQAQTIP